MAECPTCGKTGFDGTQGMRIHHTHAHGESLTLKEVECDWCGNDTTVQQDKLNRVNNVYCSGTCREDGQAALNVDERLADESALRELYHEQGLTLRELADELGSNTGTVAKYLRKYGVQIRDVGGSDPDAEYKQESWLREKYVEEGLNTYEMADAAGVTQSAIRHHMNKHEIERQAVGHNSKLKPASHHWSKGYEMVSSQSGNKRKQAGVHQLILIAHGADPHKVFSPKYDTHHRNEVKWDNTPGNLELIRHDEHARHHGEETEFWKYSPCMGGENHV